MINEFSVTKPKNKGIEAMFKNSRIKLKDVINKINLSLIFSLLFKAVKF